MAENLYHKIGITDRVVYQDGSYIGAGIVEGAANPANVLGVRCIDDKKNEVFWCDLSLRDALAMVSSLNGAIQKYMNLTGKDAPDPVGHKKVRFAKS